MKEKEKFHAAEAFDFAQPSSWPAWRQHFVCFRIAMKLDKEVGDVQVNSLYVMGKQPSVNSDTDCSPVRTD